MSAKQKSQRGFVAVTLITLLAIALVLIVYATLLGTFTGKEVVYGKNLTGEVLYSVGNLTDVGNWTDTLDIPSGTSWYACLNITSTDGYIGQVNVTFQLQKKVGASYQDQGTPTYAVMNLNGSVGQRVFVSSDGSITTNRDWKGNCEQGNSYLVKATVYTTG